MLPEEGVIQNHGDGIHVIDTGFHRPRFDACYLLIDDGRGAFIDTGPNGAVPRLLAALDATGLQPGDVDWVIPTHVHLDHAGGAGLLMQHLPHAKLMVHPRGARHLVDPGKLLDGARAVYGADAVAQAYGEVVAVPESRVLTSHDGMTLPWTRPLIAFVARLTVLAGVLLLRLGWKTGLPMWWVAVEGPVFAATGLWYLWWLNRR